MSTSLGVVFMDKDNILYKVLKALEHVVVVSHRSSASKRNPSAVMFGVLTEQHDAAVLRTFGGTANRILLES
jgi:hypothetical protein